jgi:hypothetical protein
MNLDYPGCRVGSRVNPRAGVSECGRRWQGRLTPHGRNDQTKPLIRSDTNLPPALRNSKGVEINKCVVAVWPGPEIHFCRVEGGASTDSVARNPRIRRPAIQSASPSPWTPAVQYGESRIDCPKSVLGDQLVRIVRHSQRKRRAKRIGRTYRAAAPVLDPTGERGWETGLRSAVSTRTHPRLYKVADLIARARTQNPR